MMAEPTFRALELPAFFDGGCHLSLPDFHPPHMGYRVGSVQPAALAAGRSARRVFFRPVRTQSSRSRHPRPKLARQRLTAPYSHTILCRQENLVECVRAITGGSGLDVAYDSVGKGTFLGSLESLALRGHLVNFAQSSGSVELLEVARLAA
jgi:threonine dehydrogenase-like Zn-dependent dehydrogenase